MKCIRCGCNIEYCEIGRKPKFCNSCTYIIDVEKRRLNKKRKRKYSEELGTTNFGSKLTKKDDGTPDFDKEIRQIKKEMKKLGVKNGYSKTTKK